VPGTDWTPEQTRQLLEKDMAAHLQAVRCAASCTRRDERSGVPALHNMQPLA
jgi:hypothetical protein